MDNIRLILVSALIVVLFLLWQAWQKDYVLPQTTTAAGEASVGAASSGGVMSDDPGAPEVVDSTIDQETPMASVGSSAAESTAPAQQKTVTVVTDLFTLELSQKGGTVEKLYLNEYPVSLETKEITFQLMKPKRPNLFVAQSGLISGGSAKVPTHEGIFQSKNSSYTMQEGQNTLPVELTWQGDNGIHVTKRYIFTRGSYRVEVQHLVENRSGQPLSVREYRQLLRSPEESGDNTFLYTYTGGAIYSPQEKYEKISFDDMEDGRLDRDVTGGWVSMIQHYFLGAWVPAAKEPNHFYTRVLSGGRYQIGAYSPAVTIAPNASHQFSSSLVAGPKLQEQLKVIAPGLELTVDYGWLTVLAQPIFWLLGKLYGLIGNWGWAILALTLLIKLVFYKLSETSYKSMANMRRMTPRMQALKDRYGDDKQQLNNAMMELYKKEKINPLGGCLPILIQIPVFIALYWVLLESVELRQAPFIFWIKDLSVKDPFYVLPLIMGVSMWIQQKLNPAPPDPMQAKIMMSLPFVFTVFFAFFPAGLVLYWVANNVLSIAQQWYITRKIEQAAGSG